MIKPRKNYVYVQAVKPKETTKGGLYIPASAQKVNTPKFIVLAVGPEAEDVKKGDTIIIAQSDLGYATLVQEDSESGFLFIDSSIAAVIGNDSKIELI